MMEVHNVDKVHNAEMVVGASAPSFAERETTGSKKKGLALIAKVDVRPISVGDISFTQRIRVDDGDIEKLAENISEHGLINPITVMQQEAGGFMLISGYRRLKACQLLGCDAVSAAVLSAVDAEERLRLEISENEQRKDFTYSEKLEYAEKLRAVVQEQAAKRKSTHARDGWRTNQDVDTCPHPENQVLGKTRDLVAKSVGLGSGRQYDRVSYVAKNRPDLMKQVDANQMTVGAAYRLAKKEAAEQNTLEKIHEVQQGKNSENHLDAGTASNASRSEWQMGAVPENRNAPVNIGMDHPELWEPLVEYFPGLDKNSGAGIKGAGHLKLMENHIYATLYEKYQEAIQSANIMVGSYDMAKSNFEIVLSGERSNLEAVKRERDELIKENEKLKLDLNKAEKAGQTYHQERDELRKTLEAYRKENERLQQELQNTRSEGRKRK